MITITVLILAALVLVFFEVIVPGGVLGFLALGCVMAATTLGYNEYGFLGGLVVFFCSAVTITALIFIELNYLAKSKLGKGFFLEEKITGHAVETTNPEVIGQEGVTLSRLCPSGKVAIAGKSYEACSQDGYMEANQRIMVVSTDNFTLIIKKL
jgi:membrane-bound ClpP family serine protease